jgi:Anti-sigma-K factor rskA, C-terminal/Putative zinc-finger
MNEIHALSGAYVVDALDDIERAQFARHLERCPECQAEVASLREAAALFSLTTPVEPPPGLRERVLGDIASVRPLPPVVPEAAAPSAARPSRRLRTLVAAAAAVVLVGSGATIAWEATRDGATQAPQPSATQRVLRAPDAERVTERLAGGAKATLVRSRSMNQAVLLTENMPAPPAGKVYELWLQDARKGMQPAGLMPDGASTVLLSGDAADAVGAGITVEPQGGSHVPTSDPVALFTFKST